MDEIIEKADEISKLSIKELGEEQRAQLRRLTAELQLLLAE